MLILKNGNVKPMAGEDFTGDILIDGGKIASFGTELEKSFPDAEVINVTGCTVIPGIIDAHCHIGMWEDGMGTERFRR